MDLRFCPLSRIAPFICEIYYFVENVKMKLVEVSGTCHGVGAAFDIDTLDFGIIVKNSKLTKLLKLENIGDIGTKFHFTDTELFKPHFM
jgi:hydrocephalus-inducing protein